MLNVFRLLFLFFYDYNKRGSQSIIFKMSRCVSFFVTSMLYARIKPSRNQLRPHVFLIVALPKYSINLAYLLMVIIITRAFFLIFVFQVFT
mgnify:FL=1